MSELAGPGAHCALWLPKKKRYCRFARVPGHEFCGHHLAERKAEAGDARKRIPCPLDPSHSIFADDLERHLKICPRAKGIAEEERLPCFSRDCNVGAEARGPTPSSPPPAEVPAATAASAAPPPSQGGQAIHKSLVERPEASSHLSSLSQEALLELLDRLRRAHAEFALDVRDGAGAAEADEVRDADGSGAPLAKRQRKHGVQNEAIVAAVRSLGLLRSPDARSVLVELGAGKGALAAAFVDAHAGGVGAAAPAEAAPAEAAPSALAARPAGCATSVVLVDRIKPRLGCDPRMLERGARVCRVKIDLRHLRLRGVPEVWDGRPERGPEAQPRARSQPAQPAAAAAGSAAAPDAGATAPQRVAVAKHLCGVATDYTLRCIADAGVAAFDGIAIATCCHHRCTWEGYVNTAFLAELGLGETEFKALALISSWCTGCRGHGGSARSSGGAAAADEAAEAAGEIGEIGEIGELGDAGGGEEHAAADDAAARLGSRLGDQLEGALDARARAHLGWQAKRLLDTGRARYLQQRGYRVHMQAYVPEHVSPENVLLLAAPEAEPGAT